MLCTLRYGQHVRYRRLAPTLPDHGDIYHDRMIQKAPSPVPSITQLRHERLPPAAPRWLAVSRAPRACGNPGGAPPHADRTTPGCPRGLVHPGGNS